MASTEDDLGAEHARARGGEWGTALLTEGEDVFYDKKRFITTKLGNKISRKSVLCGSDKICVLGKAVVEAGAVIRGDLAAVEIGKHCIIGENVVLRGPDQLYKGGVVFIPIYIGKHVVIERDSTVQAASVGSHVWVGRGCAIDKRCVIKDCVRILDGTVLAPGTVVPPYTVYGGVPGRMVGRLPESYPRTVEALTTSFYEHFKPAKRE